MTADIEKRVDNRRLQQVSGAHTADITELFQSLVAKGALVKKGHGRWSKGKWFSRAEIAKLMGRNAEDLRKRFINPLVLEGLLQKRYPDKPNSKEQAYRTVSKDAIEGENG